MATIGHGPGLSNENGQWIQVRLESAIPSRSQIEHHFGRKYGIFFLQACRTRPFQHHASRLLCPDVDRMRKYHDYDSVFAAGPESSAFLLDTIRSDRNGDHLSPDVCVRGALYVRGHCIQHICRYVRFYGVHCVQLCHFIAVRADRDGWHAKWRSSTIPSICENIRLRGTGRAHQCPV